MSSPQQQGCPLNEQAVGWALHALEPDEEIAVLLHLPQCASCQGAVHEAEEVLSRLGAAVEQVDPPASLRDALLARAGRTPQRPRVLRPRTSPETLRPVEGPAPRHRAMDDRSENADGRPADPKPVVPPPARSRPTGARPGASRPSDSRPPHRSWLSRRSRSLLAASLALVAVLAVGGLAIRTAQLEQRSDQQAQSIAEFVTGLDQPGTRHAVLAQENGTTVAAVLVADGQRQVFTVGLPSNAADRSTYVLWATRAGADPAAIGTFDVAADQGLRNVGSAPEETGVTGYAISIEPGRTAPATPSTVVASGQVEV